MLIINYLVGLQSTKGSGLYRRSRFERLDARFVTIELRFDSRDRRLQVSNIQFDAIELAFDAIEPAFDALEPAFEATEPGLRAGGKPIDEIYDDRVICRDRVEDALVVAGHGSGEFAGSELQSGSQLAAAKVRRIAATGPSRPSSKGLARPAERTSSRNGASPPREQSAT